MFRTLPLFSSLLTAPSSIIIQLVGQLSTHLLQPIHVSELRTGDSIIKLVNGKVGDSSKSTFMERAGYIKASPSSIC